MANKKIDVLVLSAGAGTRIKNKYSIPKGLIPFKGDIALSHVIKPYINDKNFRININVRKNEVEYFKRKYDSIYRLFIENTPLGNAGAIKKFGKELSDPFIVTHNDCRVLGFNPMEELIRVYERSLYAHGCFVMLLKNIALEKEYGIAMFDIERIIGFTRDRYINCGIYCVGHKTLQYIKSGFQDIDNNLIPTLIRHERIKCSIFNGFYEDWGK